MCIQTQQQDWMRLLIGLGEFFCWPISWNKNLERMSNSLPNTSKKKGNEINTNEKKN